MTDLLLKSSGPVADQYKVLAGDQVVGHIRLSESAHRLHPGAGLCLMGSIKGRRTPTHGYGATREEALQAFARAGIGNECQRRHTSHPKFIHLDGASAGAVA